MNSTSFKGDEARDEISSICAMSSTCTPDSLELSSISSSPSYIKLRDRIYREELKQAVEDVNRDNSDGVVKDGLDITLRSYRVRASFVKRRMPNIAVEDSRLTYVTSDEDNVSSSTFPSFECNNVEDESITRSLSALCEPHEEIILSTKHRKINPTDNFMNSATSVLDFDSMVLS